MCDVQLKRDYLQQSSKRREEIAEQVDSCLLKLQEADTKVDLQQLKTVKDEILKFDGASTVPTEAIEIE